MSQHKYNFCPQCGFELKEEAVGFELKQEAVGFELKEEAVGCEESDKDKIKKMIGNEMELNLKYNYYYQIKNMDLIKDLNLNEQYVLEIFDFSDSKSILCYDVYSIEEYFSKYDIYLPKKDREKYLSKILFEISKNIYLVTKDNLNFPDKRIDFIGRGMFFLYSLKLNEKNLIKNTDNFEFLSQLKNIFKHLNKYERFIDDK